MAGNLPPLNYSADFLLPIETSRKLFLRLKTSKSAHKIISGAPEFPSFRPYYTVFFGIQEISFARTPNTRTTRANDPFAPSNYRFFSELQPDTSNWKEVVRDGQLSASR